MSEEYSEAEWNVGEWTDEWTISVGKAYACEKCGSMVMVTKGGIGVMEPKCCSRDMQSVEKVDDIR